MGCNISTAIKEKKPLRRFEIKNGQDRIYAVKVATEGTVGDL